jgi:hypothetical protein
VAEPTGTGIIVVQTLLETSSSLLVLALLVVFVAMLKITERHIIKV